MSNPAADLRATALASLTTAGFTDATAIRNSDTIVIATVPVTRTAWADVALAALTVLRLPDEGDRARYALFTARDDEEPYSRTVYFRATGPRLPEKYVDRELCSTVRIVPGYSTEADIPKALALDLFGDLARADDITVTRLA